MGRWWRTTSWQPRATNTADSGGVYRGCGGGAGVLVAPDYTAVVKDPSSGKPSCQVADKRLDGEAAKLAWVNKYVGRIFGEGGRTFEPSAAGA